MGGSLSAHAQMKGRRLRGAPNLLSPPPGAGGTSFSFVHDRLGASADNPVPTPGKPLPEQCNQPRSLVAASRRYMYGQPRPIEQEFDATAWNIYLFYSDVVQHFAPPNIIIPYQEYIGQILVSCSCYYHTPRKNACVGDKRSHTKIFSRRELSTFFVYKYFSQSYN